MSNRAFLIFVSAFVISMTIAKVTSFNKQNRKIASVECVNDCVAIGNVYKSPSWLKIWLDSNQPLTEKMPSTIKSNDELDYYFDCYKDLVSGYSHSNFLKYKDLVKKASEVTGMNYAALACFLYRESKYNPGTKSGAGAVGLGQFMESTRKDLNSKYLKSKPALYFAGSYIDTLKTKYSSNEEMVSLLDQLENILKEPNSNKYRTLKDPEEIKSVYLLMKKIHAQGSSDPIYYWLTRAKIEYKKTYAQQAWNNYFKDQKTKYTAFDSRTNPEQSIIAAAIYMKFLDTDFEPADGWGDYNDLTHYVFLGGSYNIGPGNFKCNFEKDSIDSCLKKTRTAETRNHMKALRNCMSKGSLDTTHSGVSTKCEPYKDPKSLHDSAGVELPIQTKSIDEIGSVNTDVAIKTITTPVVDASKVRQNKRKPFLKRVLEVFKKGDKK